jgi:hypothetical protein
METALRLKSGLQTAWRRRVRLNPKIKDSMKMARLPESQNHKLHRKGAFA